MDQTPPILEFLMSAEGARALERAREARALPLHRRAKALDGLGSADGIRAALQQDDLRQRAITRCPHANQLLFTPEALEQATAWPVAAERATRWPAPSTERVTDLGAGIGLDALATALTGRPVLAYEHDPVRAAFLAHNARALGVAELVEVRSEDVLSAAPEGPNAYFDPDRRADGVRTRDPSAFAPPADAWAPLLARFSRAMIKLPPVFEGELPVEGRLEQVALGGRAREARCYVGDWGTCAERRALALPSGRSIEGTGERLPAPRTVGEGDWILDPDVSVTLAGLLGDLAVRDDLAPLHPDVAYLVGDAPNETAPGHWVRVDEILKAKPKVLNAWLRKNEVGNLTIRKRGIDTKAAAWRKKLKPAGDRAGTLLFTRGPDEKWVVCASLQSGSLALG